ncbi:hypothetical protein BGX38DRAFT_1159847 [Terfezia claveryi]|nr:hypothetical protein BGX38DRAFT_1159847 [Terfezia claveryi]
MSRTSLAQILLHISPSPLNVNETKDVYRALREYGEVELFKVVRHTNTTNLPAPTAHVIFSSQPRNLPRSFSITTNPPQPRPSSIVGVPTPPYIPRRLTLTPLPSNFAHHDHVKKIFRSIACDGIRGLRSTKDVAEDAEEEEEVAMVMEQNLIAKQKEEEPGQYGRLLRLYAGTFRGFNAMEEQNGRNGIDDGKGGEVKVKVRQCEQAAGPDWLAAISGWAPVEARKPKGPQPPKGVNTKRGFHAYVVQSLRVGKTNSNTVLEADRRRIGGSCGLRYQAL